MAALSTVIQTRDGVSVVPTVAAAGGGDTFTNTGREVLIVKNADSSSKTVTVVTSATVDGQSVGDKAVVVANGATISMGPWPRYAYGSSVSVTYSAVTSVTVLVLQVTPELA